MRLRTSGLLALGLTLNAAALALPAPQSVGPWVFLDLITRQPVTVGVARDGVNGLPGGPGPQGPIGPIGPAGPAGGMGVILRRTLDPLVPAERNSPSTILLQAGAPGVVYRWHEAHASSVMGVQSFGDLTVFAGTGPLCQTGRHEFGSSIVSPFGGGFSGPDDTAPGESLCAEFKGIFTIDSAKSGFHWEKK